VTIDGNEDGLYGNEDEYEGSVRKRRERREGGRGGRERGGREGYF
jgi:hypothetical protein